MIKKFLNRKIFITALSFCIIFVMYINFSKGATAINYYQCNKTSDVNSKKVLEKFGASDKAWKCFTDRIGTCSPAIIYGQISKKPKNVPIYFSIYGKNEDGDCIITGPLYDKQSGNVKANSCLITEMVRGSYVDKTKNVYNYDYNFVLNSIFKGNGRACTGSTTSTNGPPYCLLSESNPDLKKCNKYFDFDRYRSPDGKAEPIILSNAEVLKLPNIEMATNYNNFSPFKYSYNDFNKAIFEKSSTSSLVLTARLLARSDNVYKNLTINGRNEAINVIKKIGDMTVKYIESYSSKKGSAPNISENISAYLEVFGGLMNKDKKYELLKNRGFGSMGGVKYKSIYPFVVNGAWLTPDSVCFKDGVSVTNGMIDENGDIVFLGYYCINSKTNERTQKSGYLWNKDVFGAKK